ncbi:hypothetical protein BDW60DRAFT_75743 [Aspergillus nidulans var. acristatus]
MSCWVFCLQHTINGRAAIAAASAPLPFTLSLWFSIQTRHCFYGFYIWGVTCALARVIRFYAWLCVPCVRFCFYLFLSPSSFVQRSLAASGWFALNGTWREQEQKTPRHAGFDKQISSLLATMRLLKDFSGQRSLGLLAEMLVLFCA